VDLKRHLDVWPQLRPQQPVGSGVLVVNHQLDPHERSQTVYSRPEFVASLCVPVVSSKSLFGWGRDGDWNAVLQAVLGSDSTDRAVGPPSPDPGQNSPSKPPCRRLWTHNPRAEK
jgi:hypothetical protein